MTTMCANIVYMSESLPSAEELTRVLEKFICKIYEGRTVLSDLYMVSDRLQQIDLSMTDMKNLIYQQLEQICEIELRVMGRVARQITRTKTEIMNLFRRSKKGLGGGRKAKTFDHMPSKLQLLMEIYSHYRQIALSNMHVCLFWNILLKNGRFNESLKHKEIVVLTDKQLNHFTLANIVPETQLLQPQGFKKLLQQLTKSSNLPQQHRLKQMLNIYNWEKPKQETRAENLQLSEEDEISDYLDLAEDLQNLINDPNISLTDESILKDTLIRMKSQSDKSHKGLFVDRQQRILHEQPVFILEKLQQISLRDTEDDSKPATERTKSKNKRKNRKRKNKKKKNMAAAQQRQQKMEENPEPKQQGESPHKTHLSEEEWMPTIQMLQSMVIEDNSRASCAPVPNQIDWWKNIIQKD